MTEWYDASGVRQVKNTYDQKGRVTHQIDAGGGEYALEYFDDHTVTTDADGNRSEIWFDAQKRTTKTVDANGATVSYTYDQHSNIIAITDALGNTTRYEYDAFGNKVKETAPDGSSYSLQYDANNNLTQLTDQRGGVTRYEYDAHNRLVRQTNPDGGVIAYTYNDAGQVLTVTDPLGHMTPYEYDGVDLIKSTDPNGNATRYAYDEQHRLVSTTDALGSTTAFVYDTRDNLTAVTFADGTSFAYEYDKVGNLTSQTDALGNTTRFEYDALRQLVRTVYPDGSEEISAYDASGNVVAASDTIGSSAAAEYDGMGNLISLTDEEGNTSRYTYDLNGNLLTETLASGIETRYTYDSRNRLVKIVCGDMTVEYGYDAAGNVISLRIGDAETRYGYDSMGRISSESDSDGNITNYRYDLAGHLIELEENRKLTRSSFDASGNLLTVRENGKTAPTYRYEYNAINQLTAVYYEDGAVSRYTYNAQGEQIGSEYIEVPLNAHGTAGQTVHGSIPRLRIDISGGGQSTVGKATNLIEKAKQAEKEAAAAATRATYSAPGSLAATQAKVAQQGASLAVSRAQSVYDGGVGGSGGGIISDWVDTIGRGVQTAVSLCKDACAYANQAAAIGRNSPTAAVPDPRSSQYAQSPSVQATTRGSWACSLWDSAQRGVAARTQQQQVEANALANALLGAVNAVIRNGTEKVDAVVDIVNYACKQKSIPIRIEKNGAEWRAAVENFTRGLSTDDAAYDAGQLLGDAATVIIDYLLLFKAFGALGKAAEKIAVSAESFLATISSGLPASADGVLVIEGVGSAAISGSTEGFLAVAADILFNSSAFKEDWETLKEDLEEAEHANNSISSKESNPQAYLERALENQDLDSPPNSLKETWIEGDYKYEVRIHSGESQYTDAETIYRVSRQSILRDANGQGTGIEYLGADGSWYHETVLRQFNRDGTLNPLFDESAARITHIELPGGN